MGVLFKDSRFWAALVLLGQAVLFYLAPNFPPEVWAAANAFLGVTLAILVGNGVVAARQKTE